MARLFTELADDRGARACAVALDTTQVAGTGERTLDSRVGTVGLVVAVEQSEYAMSHAYTEQLTQPVRN